MFPFDEPTWIRMPDGALLAPIRETEMRPQWALSAKVLASLTHDEFHALEEQLTGCLDTDEWEIVEVI